MYTASYFYNYNFYPFLDLKIQQEYLRINDVLAFKSLQNKHKVFIHLSHNNMDSTYRIYKLNDINYILIIIMKFVLMLFHHLAKIVLKYSDIQMEL